MLRWQKFHFVHYLSADLRMYVYIYIYIYIGSAVDEVHIWSKGKDEVLGEKPVTASLCPLYIPQIPAWNRTRASAVRGQRRAVFQIEQ